MYAYGLLYQNNKTLFGRCFLNALKMFCYYFILNEPFQNSFEVKVKLMVNFKIF